MKINKEKLEAMINLPDEELWREVKRLGAGYGFTLPDKTPSHSDMERLRGIAGGGKINIADAMKLINEYRRNQGNG